MKCHASKLLFYFYSNYRYLPFLGLLVGMKLCVVTMLLNTKLNHTEMTEENLKMRGKGFWKNIRPAGHLDPKFEESTKVEKKEISPEVLREWKTLENLVNSTIGISSKNRTDPESVWLIFNRIPDSGDEEFLKLLNQLGEHNSFVHQTHEYRTPWKRFLVDQEQENLVRWFEYQHLPKSYDRHFFWVNFTFYQNYIKESPIYVNLVKDPMTRLKSSFLAKRSDLEEIRRRDEAVPGSGSNWAEKTFEDCVLSSDPECAYENKTEDYTLSVPFFCGQDFRCVLINNHWALQRAKFIIEKYYSVVGVYENLEESLTAFENYIPRFFSSAREIYKKGLGQDTAGIGKTRRELKDERVRSVLQKKLPGEFELYRFINARLRAQIGFLQNKNTQTTSVD